MALWHFSSLTSMAPLASFAVTWAVIVWLLRSFSDRILDHPNERLLSCI
jgi:hypothetical protein